MAAAAAAAIVGALPIMDIYGKLEGEGLCVENSISHVGQPEKIEGLSKNEAKHRMSEWVKKDPEHNVADCTYWFGVLGGSWTIRLYRAEGDIVFKKYDGKHGIDIDNNKFKYKGKIQE